MEYGIVKLVEQGVLLEAEVCGNKHLISLLYLLDKQLFGNLDLLESNLNVSLIAKA